MMNGPVQPDFTNFAGAESGTALSGEVDHVVYASEDGTYTVFRVRDGQGNVHTAVGSVAGIAPGQSVTLTGKWELHKEHGRQFRVESYEFALPVTRDGILRYLSSGIIKGIGKKYAEAIVDTFGKETLAVLDNQSRRLSEVPGLGRKRIAAIKTAWKDNTERRESQIYLQGLGITPAYFSRIYELYGNAAAKIVRENPYRLAEDVKGIGFLLADRIAREAGIGPSDPRRLAAGVTYALSQNRLSGHVCMPERYFIPFLAELLSIPEDSAVRALDSAILMKKARRTELPDGDTMIYEPGLLHCEDELPRLIRNLLNCKNHYGQLFQRVGTLPGSKFSDEQLAAVDRASRSPVSIITGGPGVGKTTVVSELVRRAKLAKLRITLAAPTGRAAKRMTETTGLPAATIHRLLKWDPVNGKFQHGIDNPLNSQLLVVDESSMLDILLAVALFRAVAPGTCLVIVGDPDQLPSVGPGSVLTDLIDSGICPVSRLTKIFRQGDGSGIIRAAHNVNAGELPLPGPSVAGSGLSDFYWIEKDDPEEAADVILRVVCERIPARFGLNPMSDVQVLCPMNRGPAGTVVMNQRLQELLNPETKQVFRSGERLFKRGDKVMQIVNNYDKNVFNGDLGIIRSIDTDSRSMSVRYDSMTVEYPFEDTDQIVPAYAVTVHKSQGAEFPVVVMPLLSSHYMMLQRNLLYTGITRAKRLMILVASGKAVSMAVRNSVREPRYSMLYEKLRSGGQTL